MNQSDGPQQPQPELGIASAMAFTDPNDQMPIGLPVVAASLPTPQSIQRQQQLRAFWADQRQEIQQATNIKSHALPLARVKRKMKADRNVRMVSAEASALVAKASEMLISELTLRSWTSTEENRRRTIQYEDMVVAILRAGEAAYPFLGSPFFPVGPSGMMVGRPVDQMPLYPGQQPQPSLPLMPWRQALVQPPHPPQLPQPWPEAQVEAHLPQPQQPYPSQPQQ